jgi:Coenzyme PQQ synthesis protein D (PqqD)
MAAECQNARTEGLVVEEIGDELLVYDLDTDEAHSLDPVAAAIWRACDGTTTTADIAARLNLDEGAVQATLKHLGELNLLTGEARVVAVTHSRRAVLRRGLVAGAAGAVAIPVIRSIVAPATADAISVCQATIPFGSPCAHNCECTDGCCCDLPLGPGGLVCLEAASCQMLSGTCVS